ncbi:STAS/SEC14 domain-containing protein [Azospirillaceae bacterium]
MDIHYSEENVIVYWDADHNRVYVDWRGIPSDRTVQKGCEEMLKLLIQQNGHFVLNDNRNVIGPWNSSAQWVAEDWFPRMLSAGLEKFAWVQSKNLLSKFASRQTTALNKDSGAIRLFDSYDDAIHWLGS